jgi:glycerol-3-phosphate dehydrogenase
LNLKEVGVAANDCVDLLIIGGGINGAGIARDAAGRDLKVALVEQGDLASATSSASTKLIHGGLRYLEFFEFRLVREALTERERLLAIAPHIIKPLRFVLPHVEGLRPRWMMRLGLFFYDHAGGRKRLPSSRNVLLGGADYGLPLRADIAHGFTYSDCWVDDSRLVVLNAMDAAERGAQIHTRTKVVSATAGEGIWNVECRNAAGRRMDFKARGVVNAAGPWVQDVLGRFPGVELGKQHVRLVKGSHIVVPKLYEGDHAYTLQHPDGRVVFTIPYEADFTAIGTTDVAFTGDIATAGISQEETAYLCETVNRYFVGRPLTPADVKWSYAGVRPLFDDDAAVSASKVSRDYKLELLDAPAGGALLSVFGGKITTYRKLAEAALEKLQPHIGGALRPWTDRAALPGGNLPRQDFAAFLAQCKQRWPFLSDANALRLARGYGTRLEKILGNASKMSDLGAHFGAGLTQAEVDYLCAHEWASTAEDILWRRTKVGLHMTSAELLSFTQMDAQLALRQPAARAH